MVYCVNPFFCTELQIYMDGYRVLTWESSLLKAFKRLLQSEMG